MEKTEEGKMISYGFEVRDNELKFWCSDEKIFNDIQDYIQRYIDAEDYRRMLHPEVITRV